LATLAEKYIKKGSQIYVEGKIQSRAYEKDGIKRYFTEIYADTIQLLGRKPEGGEAPATTVAEPASDMQAPPPAVDDLPF
jgi:single-strand DNA-binding protein